MDYPEYSIPPDAELSPRPPADGYMPDPPLWVDRSQANDDRPERFLDEQLCAYNACSECFLPLSMCICHSRGD